MTQPLRMQLHELFENTQTGHFLDLLAAVMEEANLTQVRVQHSYEYEKRLIIRECPEGYNIYLVPASDVAEIAAAMEDSQEEGIH
jgi:hypothetical protein